MRKTARKNMAALGTAITLIVLIVAGAFIAGKLRDHGYFCPIMQRNRCLANLKAIDAAKRLYGEELNLTDGKEVAAERLLDYLPGGNRSLRCPGGGTYTINPLGRPPECSKPDHKITE